ncbi:hypothetical protein DFS34DRAFT_650224 [Phlyctochytrium arcticum]|nr:hypothetical protein DFS34DRAFT_650224 [Phlyctochytrium arcticum]
MPRSSRPPSAVRAYTSGRNSPRVTDDGLFGDIPSEDVGRQSRRPSRREHANDADEGYEEDDEGNRDVDDDDDESEHNAHDSGNATDPNEDENEARRLRDVQEAINVSHPFGLRIWKPALYRKFRSIDTKTYNALHANPGEHPRNELYFKPGNILWCLLFGWWLALIYLLIAVFVLGPIALIGYIVTCLIYCGKRPKNPVPLQFRTCIEWVFLELLSVWQYAKVLINISGYMFWPFGKFIAKRRIYHMVFRHGGQADENTSLMADQPEREAFCDGTYVVGINEDESVPPSPQLSASEAPRLVPHRDVTPSDPDNLSDVSEESWRDYTTNDRHYNYSARQHKRWPKWVPRWLQRIYNAGLAGNIFRVLLLLTIAPVQFAVTCACSFMVFSLPMAKLNYVLLKHLLRHPLQISAHTPVFTKSPRYTPSRSKSYVLSMKDILRRSSRLFWRPASILSTSDEPFSIPTTLGTPRTMPVGAVAQGPQIAPEFQVILCTYNALGWEYYKYTYDGINIFIINMIAVVIFSLVDFYVIGPRNGYTGIANSSVIFAASLVSSIPLAYFIGMAVASITSETGSLAIGAVINATFGSIIEIILYALALVEGKTRIVEGAVIGSLLAGLLALPGVSMFFGGLKKKEQNFNAKSAGVTSTMLIMAIIGMFTPTWFQEVYGTQELKCLECPVISENMNAAALALSCKQCHLVNTRPSHDPIYQSSTKILSWICAAALLLMYGIGLWFTLRTHSRLIYDKPDDKEKKRKRVKRPSPSYTDASPLPNGLGISDSAAGGQSASVTGNLTTASKRNARTISDEMPGLFTSQEPNPPSEYPFPRLDINTSGLYARGRVSAPNSAPITAQAALPSPMLTSRGIPCTNGVVQVLATEGTNEPIMDEWDSGAGSDEGSDDDGAAGHGGHDHPNWSITKSGVVLLTCTVLYSLVAEVLISSVDEVIQGYGIDEKVLGATLFSLVPLVTEFYNAVAFALNNNIALSLEIGSAYVIQAAMLQIPVIVAFSAFYVSHVNQQALTSAAAAVAAPVARGLAGRSGSPLGKVYNVLASSWDHLTTTTAAQPALVEATKKHTMEGFTMIFPRWDLYAVIFGTFLLSYVYIEGKANYFKGSMLLMAYFILLGAYAFEPNVESWE